MPITAHIPFPIDLSPRAAPGPLLDLVRAAARETTLWQPLVRFDTTSRYWAHVLGSDDVDLWLLSWLPGQQTGLHDHGGAAAAVTVVSGALQEVRATAAGSVTSSRLSAGDAVWVPPEAVHDFRHTGSAPAISLHAYSPRLERMTYYERERDGLSATRTVVTAATELSVVP